MARPKGTKNKVSEEVKEEKVDRKVVKETPKQETNALGERLYED